MNNQAKLEQAAKLLEPLLANLQVTGPIGLGANVFLARQLILEVYQGLEPQKAFVPKTVE